MKLENIKYKAKRIYNGEWVYGDLLHQSDGIHIYMGKGEGGRTLCPRVDPSTVCQFTGLKDMKEMKFGKAICLHIDTSKIFMR